MSDEYKTETLEMIAVMQAYVDGKTIEVGRRGCAASTIEGEDLPTWNWEEYRYRIATIPDSINWDHESPEWKYMARDESGSVYLYEAEPRMRDYHWGVTEGDCHEAKVFLSHVFGSCDWKDSLVKRPD